MQDIQESSSEKLSDKSARLSATNRPTVLSV